MNPAALTTIHRLTANGLPLPALCMMLGSALLADTALCALGMPSIPNLRQGSVSLPELSFACTAGIVGMFALAHAVVPCWVNIARLICWAVPILRWLLGTTNSFKADKYHYLITDVVARAVEKNNKIVADLVSERRAEVDRERKLRLFALALLTTICIDLCPSGSILRHVVDVTGQSSGLTWTIALIATPLVCFVLNDAFLAFHGVESDDWISRIGLESFMEDQAPTNRVVGPDLSTSPLARHVRFPSSTPQA